MTTNSVCLDSEVPSWPYLPVEIIQRIVEDAWSLPLSGGDRVTLLTSLPLVNKTFLSIYNRLVFRDVHIPTPDYAHHYLSLLSSRTPAQEAQDTLHPRLSIPPPFLTNSLCRTLAFHIPGGPEYPANHPIQLYSEHHPMGDALSQTLYQLSRLPWAPNLHRLTIEYTNWGYNDLFDQYRLLDVPLSISTLELRFLFSDDTPQRLIAGLKERYFGRQRWQNGYFSLSNVRDLVVAGACLEFVVDAAEMCPELEILEVDELQGLHVLAPLRPSVHTLVLRGRKDFVLDEDSLGEMQLSRALNSGLFQAGRPSRIMLDVARVERAAFESAVNVCAKHNIELVHRSIFI